MKHTIIILLCLSLLLPFLIRKPAETVPVTDYGTLTAAEQDVFRDILSAVEAGETKVYCEEEPDSNRLTTHLGMYYGDLNDIGNLYVTVNGNLHLNLSEFAPLEENRSELNGAVEEAISHIREGSDRYKLWQISRYISRTYEYNDDFVCANYAILFYHIASRLGIETYICFGYVSTGYHAWNMVVIDNKNYYYDITFYDGSRSFGYLHSSDQWDRVSALNDLWAALQKG